MLQTFLVFLGGGLGAAMRHGVNIGSARVFGINFPVGTMVVNVTGSLVMGLIVAYLAFKADQPWSQNLRLFLTTGILG
ncbi:MAG TPA: CrcB family protein, partial [Bauldia sp.]|nr:CrcB family protein [Bauldia sp.]